MSPQRLTALAALVTLSATLAFACDRAPPPDGLKDWTAADHDGEKKAASNPKQGPKGDGGSGGASALADLTWRAQCASCHGPTGHGDGPQGAMFKASDLSREDWQAGVKDEEIAATIANGKGRMPKFDLPAEVVSGLVVRVRSFRGN
jgi:mono/diheme cytochrome c family protein